MPDDTRLSRVNYFGVASLSARGGAVFWRVGFSPLQFSVPKGTGETGDWRNTSDLGATAFSSCLQFVASHWRVISSSLKNGSSGVGLAGRHEYRSEGEG